MSASSDNRFGKYELLERLAAGGMAEIFRARYSPAPGVVKPVVIKKILPHYAANRAFIAMFTNEAKIVMGLSHGNIAQVFDFGEVEGEWYLAMELVDGQPLSKVIKRMRALGFLTLPTEFAVFLVAEMLKGLHYAHARLDEKGRPLQIVHRDVSPQNVLVSYEGQVKLVDFGIARARNAGSEDTSSNAVKGKYAYFAPEQARGKELDARTDVFAAGIVLYELLTGQLPFQGRMMEVLTKIVRGQFARPGELNPAVPKALEAIVLKAMALEPKERFQTAEAFHQDLVRYLAVHHPDFTPSDVSQFLSFLFEAELVKSGRPVQLPRDFLARTERWKRGEPVPEPAPEAPPPSGEDPEETVPTEMVKVSLGVDSPVPGPAGPGDDEALTRPMHLPIAAAAGEAPPADGEPDRGPRAPVRRALLLGAGATFVGFAVVFLGVKLMRGSLEITSQPPGAVVRLNGRTLDEKTPLTLSSLPGATTYRIELVSEGYKTWTRDVALPRGARQLIEARLEPLAPPPAVSPKPPPPPEPLIAPTLPAPPPSADAVRWPTGPFLLDASRHRLDLSAAGAVRVALDESQAYRLTVSRGPTFGWGYYVVNAAGAAPGPLPSGPQLIKGATQLFVFRVGASTLSGERRADETRPRTLTLESRGRARRFKGPGPIDIPPAARVTLTGLDPKARYEVLVRHGQPPARVRAPDTSVGGCVVGHPTRGLLVARLDTPLVVEGARQLFFTLLDDASDAQTGRLSISITEVKRR